jgi:integrase
MARTRTAGIQVDDAGNRTIDKLVHGQRIKLRLGSVSQSEAEQRLAEESETIKRAKLRPAGGGRTFREAAAKYLRDIHLKPSSDAIAIHIETLDSWIGALPLERVYDEALEPYKKQRLEVDQVSATTLKRELEVVRRVLRLCAGKYRDELGRTWLPAAPLISMPELDPRKPYPLSWDEQRLLLAALPKHLARMALFKLYTGCREQEVCRLRWEWEQRIPELGTSVFLIPKGFGGRTDRSGVKNGEDRLVVLGRVAASIIAECRGEHDEFVFVYGAKGKKHPIARMNNSAWETARREAAQEYEKQHQREAPAGFRNVRVHDLKHTFGRRLRAARVPLETRKVLLGHRSDDITTHYSAPEIAELLEAVNRIEEARMPTLLRVAG